jgi:hypothetical protein
MESFVRSKNLVCDVIIAHKVVILGYGEVKVCCSYVPTNVFNHSLWSISKKIVNLFLCV